MLPSSAPTSMAPTEPKVLASIAAVDLPAPLPVWKDKGLLKLIFWVSWIMAAQMASGYDQVVTSAFQAMDPWMSGPFFPLPRLDGERLLT